MHLSKLYKLPLEPLLTAWMAKFDDLDQLFAGLPELYAKLSNQVVEGTIGEGVSLVGPIHVGAGSFIGANCVLVGPVIIGEGVEVGPNTVLQSGTYIGSESRLEGASFVSGSLILNRSHIFEMASIRDSVIGSEAEVGAQTIVGARNYTRESKSLPTFVGDSVCLGAGVKVSQGSTLGADCTAEQGAVVHGEFNPGTTITAKS